MSNDFTPYPAETFDSVELFKVLDRFQCIIEEHLAANCVIHVPRGSTKQYAYTFYNKRDMEYSIPIKRIDTHEISLYVSYYEGKEEIRLVRSYSQAEAYQRRL